MKYAITALLVVHGLITLLGFVKAFDLLPVTQLQAPISQPAGLLWLAAALLLVGSGVALLVGAQWWWVPAALGVVLSQILIFGDWGDAKAGTIANVILLIPIVVAALGAAPWSLGARYDHDVTSGLHLQVPAPKLVTEADIAHLPPAVQRYLAFVGAVGKPQVQNYRLRFGGALRNGPDDKWMPMVAHQQSFVTPPRPSLLRRGLDAWRALRRLSPVCRSRGDIPGTCCLTGDDGGCPRRRDEPQRDGDALQRHVSARAGDPDRPADYLGRVGSYDSARPRGPTPATRCQRWCRSTLLEHSPTSCPTTARALSTASTTNACAGRRR